MFVAVTVMKKTDVGFHRAVMSADLVLHYNEDGVWSIHKSLKPRETPGDVPISPTARVGEIFVDIQRGAHPRQNEAKDQHTFSLATDTAGRRIYLDERGWYWTFCRIADKAVASYFPVFAGQDPRQLMVGSYEGTEATAKAAGLNILWLSPQEFFSLGGELPPNG